MAVQSYGGGIVTHVYDGTVQYTSGIFQYFKEDEAGSSIYSTPPRAPKKAWPESVLVYGRNPQGLGLEKILKKIVPGQDGRSRVSKTTELPHCIHSQLTMLFSKNECGGSGSIVGPHHVLTCGHNVYDPETKTWADSISVYPALNGKSAPFGELKVVKVYTFADWTEKGDTNFDIALLILNRSIGKYTGWGGIISTPDSILTTQRVHITGYPGDKNCNEMWTMEHTMKTLLFERFEYEIDTYRGQSGSAIWFKKFGLPIIIGVHTNGIENVINWGTRISHQKFTKFVIHVISETRKINKPPHPRQITPFAAVPAKPAGAPPGEDEYRKALATEHKFENWHAKYLLYKSAAEKGYPPAMGKLGDCYFGFGEGGVEKNGPEAIRWYRLGVEQGDPHSEFRLGTCYFHGAQVTRDFDEGARLMVSAVQKGYPADISGFASSPKYAHLFKNASLPKSQP